MSLQSCGPQWRVSLGCPAFPAALSMALGDHAGTALSDRRSGTAMPHTKPIVFSGIQPSGDLHLGNYIGAIRNWVAGQTQFDNIFCVVDLHAITVYQPPEMLRTKIRETVGVLLACGIDAAQSLLFIQSH